MTSPFGFDTAASVFEANAGGRAVDRLGQPSFWVRSLSPCRAGVPLDASRAHALAECRAIWDSGARCLVPSMEAADRLGGTRSMGVSDAMTFCHAIRNVYNWVAPLEVPSSTVVFAYLTQPSGYELALAYWQGWAGYVQSFSLGGHHPLYPALRCDPAGNEAGCRTVNRATAPDCWAVWATAPRHTGTVPEALAAPWAPSRCSNPFPATLMWQVLSDPSGPPVSVDRTSPQHAVGSSMFVLLDRP